MSILAPPATGARGRASDEAIDALLSAVEVRLRRQVRITTAPGDVIALDRGALSVVYVIEGSARLRAADTESDPCARLDVMAGDIVLTAGRRPRSLQTPEAARVLISTLALTESAAHIADLLPEIGFVRGFDRHEPAAAALAVSIGIDPADETFADRSGDTVVCRMMATTVLVSALRAWAAHGCAPAGWPSLTNDPYLDRVVEAIHAEPGRDWTVDGLAAVSAMSRTVFAERFRGAFGLSPASYVTEVRIRAAQDLLVRGHGVSEISRSLGYGSDEGFSRAFRRRTGTTPSAWRAAHAAA